MSFKFNPFTGTLDYYESAPTDAVSSVFGRAGAVVAQQADYDSFFVTPAEAVAAFSPLGHTHAASEVISGTFDVARIPDLSSLYSVVGHLHTGVYSPVGHTHAGVYSPVGHTHDWVDITGEPTTIGGYGITDFDSLGDARWSPLGHNHNSAYSPLGHTHDAGSVISGVFAEARIPDLSAVYSPVGHLHTGVYSPVSHDHAGVYQPADGDLFALAGLAATAGILVRPGVNTFAVRTLVGTANEVDVANGTGAAANPTISLPAALTFTGKTITGGTYTSPLAITGLPDPTSAQDVATKAYVDSVAAGLDVKPSVKCATTANITLSGEQTLDGVLTSASRVLVKNQSAPAQNGIYLSAAGAWARVTDMDSWGEVPGSFVFVDEGTLYGDTAWVSTANLGGTLGTTAITWSQFSGAGTYTATGGITLTGTQFSITPVGITAAMMAASAIDLASSVVAGLLPASKLTGTLAQFNTALTGADFATGGGTATGTNTGDQTSIVGITGTIAQFNTTLTDGDFATIAGVETLTSKTLTTPAIVAAGWANANHTHAGSTTGGTIAISDTTGTLTVARGGTNATSFTAGSILFAGAGGTSITQDNAYLFWDLTNHRFGLGTATPSGIFTIRKDATVGSSDGAFLMESSGSNANLLFMGPAAASNCSYIESYRNGYGATPLVLNSIGGSVGIGMIPTLYLGLNGDAVRTIGMERRTAALLDVGKALTITGGGASSGATDKAGGALIMQAGVGTGNSVPALVRFTGPAASATSGTADRTIVDRLVLNVTRDLSLTSGVAQNTSLCVVECGNGQAAGGTVVYSIQATNGTEILSCCGAVHFSVVHKYGTSTTGYTLTYNSVGTESVSATGGVTIANTFSLALYADAVGLQIGSTVTGINAAWRITYSVFSNSQQSLVV